MSYEGTIIAALVVVVGGVILARRVHVPYTIALVVIGLVIGAVPIVPRIVVTPHLILLVFLPPLLFEASFNLGLPSLRRTLPIILVLAVPGVVASTWAMAHALHWSLGMPLASVLVLGALLAATDPVSVLAIFRDVRAPGRLATVVEGESLLNDGTAIVLFEIVLASALGGRSSVGAGVVVFFRVAVGGALLGLLVGLAATWVLQQIDDHPVEITVTTVVAYGTYLMADAAGLSGVIAVVAASLLVGNLRSRSMSTTTRVALESFWEYVAFLGNALVFLLVGMVVSVPDLMHRIGDIAVVIGFTLLVRLAVVALANLALRPWRRHLPWRWLPVVWWGGVRGAVAVALALSLPLSLPNRDWIQVMAFGVVVFSLVVEGLTVRPLLTWQGLRRSLSLESQYQRHLARLRGYREALRAIQRARQEGLLPVGVAERVRADYERAVSHEQLALATMHLQHDFLEAEELREARRQALLAEQAALLDLWHRNRISDDVLHDLVEEINRGLEALDQGAEPDAEPAP
ncbi:MAG TPA: Na+/H+ antiporter [Thermomicrobiaceae bacterium]|nr:Na+/H+ antiporter [Thermomicrobiaceae bacterium]